MDQITKVKNRFRLEQWQKLILECQSSDLTVKEWCSENGVNHHTYYYYLKKIRQEELKKLPATISDIDSENELTIFQKLEVQTPVPNTQAAVIIRLPQATVEIAEGTSQQTVQAVLLALQSVC